MKKKLMPLNKCRWHAEMFSCYDNELEQEVFYWKVWNIEGNCGLTQDGVELLPKENFRSAREAADNLRKFLASNDITDYKLEYDE